MKPLFAKLCNAHEVLRRDYGASLLWINRPLVPGGTHHAFRKIDARGLPVARPDLPFGMADRYAPTRGAPATASPISAQAICAKASYM
jgi:3-isopropylmalate/(R)-2-methylmalate dehydratase large subunit